MPIIEMLLREINPEGVSKRRHPLIHPSNNLPSNIAKYYLETVIACNSCPMDLVTDLGAESGVMAGIHSSLCNDPNSHRYGPSPRNQCIEV